MSADLLRRAAAKIRETAATATPGPWIGSPDSDAQVVFPGRRSHSENLHPAVVVAQGFDGGARQCNVEHIALWSPDVALLIAQHLDDDAAQLESGSCDEPGSVDRSITLARRILEEDDL